MERRMRSTEGDDMTQCRRNLIPRNITLRTATIKEECLLQTANVGKKYTSFEFEPLMQFRHLVTAAEITLANTF
jgi:hypothetical protein